MNGDSTIRLLTWNIWFSPFRDRDRMRAIAEEVARLDPDIVAFQEMTERLAHFLETGRSPLGSRLRKLRTDAPAHARYFEVIYSRFSPGPGSGRRPYSVTWMGRGCTILHLESLSLAVATTHLESLDHAAMREHQLEEAFRLLQGLPVRNRILCGDMNLRNGQQVEHLLPPRWQDAWLLLRPHEEGATRDLRRNPMTSDPLRDRLDRFFFSCPEFEPERIDLVGTEPIEVDGQVFPSDHFGLLLTLKSSLALEEVRNKKV